MWVVEGEGQRVRVRVGQSARAPTHQLGDVVDVEVVAAAQRAPQGVGCRHLSANARARGSADRGGGRGGGERGERERLSSSQSERASAAQSVMV